jgi:hypothetical protein
MFQPSRWATTAALIDAMLWTPGRGAAGIEAVSHFLPVPADSFSKAGNAPRTVALSEAVERDLVDVRRFEDDPRWSLLRRLRRG